MNKKDSRDSMAIFCWVYQNFDEIYIIILKRY